VQKKLNRVIEPI